MSRKVAPSEAENKRARVVGSGLVSSNSDEPAPSRKAPEEPTSPLSMVSKKATASISPGGSAQNHTRRTDVGIVQFKPYPMVVFPPITQADDGKEMIVHKLTSDEMKSLEITKDTAVGGRGLRVRYDEDGKLCRTEDEIDYSLLRVATAQDIMKHMDRANPTSVVEKRVAFFRVRYVASSTKNPDSPWKSLAGIFVDGPGGNKLEVSPGSINMTFFTGYPDDVDPIEPGDEIVFLAFTITRKKRDQGESNGFAYTIPCPSFHVDIGSRKEKGSPMMPANIYYHVRKQGNEYPLKQGDDDSDFYV